VERTARDAGLCQQRLNYERGSRQQHQSDAKE